METQDIIKYVAIGVFLISAFVALQYFNLWLRCLLAGAPVPFPKLIAMKIRNTPVDRLVDAYIICIKVGIPIEMEELEAEYLAAPDDFTLYVQERVKLHREEKMSEPVDTDNPYNPPENSKNQLDD
mgnify:CR=1 FL=1